MSIAEQILRIQTARNKIRTKLVALGLVTSVADIDTCATAVDGITDQGAVSATVQEGDTYTIPKGYHNGSGTVSGVAGGGNYGLQSKTVTPTKAQQNITPDSGYYGMSDVTVAPIPDNYQDVSPVTAGAADVLSNKVFVDATGKSVVGTMPNNGGANTVLNTGFTEYTIPEGYHNGTGTVKILLQDVSATPSKKQQTLTPDFSYVIGSVNIEPIPDAYQDVTGVTAEAANVLSGKKFVAADGTVVTGSMVNNDATSKTIDGLTVTSVSIPAGYTTGGTVSLTGDIEEALAAI